MGVYLQEVDVWLDERLWHAVNEASGGGEDYIPTLKRAIKEKILESYHNGQKDMVRRCEAILHKLGYGVEELEAQLSAANPRKKSTKPRSKGQRTYERRN